MRKGKVFISALLCLLLVFASFLFPSNSHAVALVDDVIIAAAVALIAVGFVFSTNQEMRDAATILYTQASAELKQTLDQFPTHKLIGSQSMVDIWNMAKTWSNVISGGGSITTPRVPNYTTPTVLGTGMAQVASTDDFINNGDVKTYAITAVNNSINTALSFKIRLGTTNIGDSLVASLEPGATAVFYITVRRFSATTMQAYRPSTQTWESVSMGLSTFIGVSCVNIVDWGFTHSLNALPEDIVLSPSTLTSTVSDTTWNGQWNNEDTGTKKMIGWPTSWPSISAPGTLDTLVGKTAQQLQQDNVIQQEYPVDTETGWLQGIFEGIHGLTTTIGAWFQGIYDLVQSIKLSLTSFFDLSQPINFDPLTLAGLAVSTKFPFSIPWDVFRIVEFFNVTPAPLEVNFPIPLPKQSIGSAAAIQFDLAYMDPYMPFLRAIIYLLFCLGLAKATKKMLVGDS